ncbi:hypothetical protein SHKM778_22980 [Streptomyces sp. KM77-8]|uniref:Uncharacterized protein n=1 Tax=Streptomyces haneummycinicus TaxID=3074435 RepID=A0AAT9HF17_9ACTN
MPENECLFRGEEEVGVVGRVLPAVAEEGGNPPDGVGDARDEGGAVIGRRTCRFVAAGVLRAVAGVVVPAEEVGVPSAVAAGELPVEEGGIRLAGEGGVRPTVGSGVLPAEEGGEQDRVDRWGGSRDVGQTGQAEAVHVGRGPVQDGDEQGRAAGREERRSTSPSGAGTPVSRTQQRRRFSTAAAWAAVSGSGWSRKPAPMLVSHSVWGGSPSWWGTRGFVRSAGVGVVCKGGSSGSGPGGAVTVRERGVRPPARPGATAIADTGRPVRLVTVGEVVTRRNPRAGRRSPTATNRGPPAGLRDATGSLAGWAGNSRSPASNRRISGRSARSGGL